MQCVLTICIACDGGRVCVRDGLLTGSAWIMISGPHGIISQLHAVLFVLACVKDGQSHYREKEITLKKKCNKNPLIAFGATASPKENGSPSSITLSKLAENRKDQ